MRRPYPVFPVKCAASPRCDRSRTRPLGPSRRNRKPHLVNEPAAAGSFGSTRIIELACRKREAAEVARAQLPHRDEWEQRCRISIDADLHDRPGVADLDNAFGRTQAAATGHEVRDRYDLVDVATREIESLEDISAIVAGDEKRRGIERPRHQRHMPQAERPKRYGGPVQAISDRNSRRVRGDRDLFLEDPERRANAAAHHDGPTLGVPSDGRICRLEVGDLRLSRGRKYEKPGVLIGAPRDIPEISVRDTAAERVRREWPAP